MHSMDIYDTAVIGGGASGMMAAGTAAAGGARVVLIEKNSVVGKKLSITGGGRCNITNNTPDFKAFLENFPQAKKFLYSPFSRFSATDTEAFFTKHNLPLVTQARNRMFPHTEQAPDVTRVMRAYCTANNVCMALNQTVTKINHPNGVWQITTKSQSFSAHKIILSTGGYAAPETGSTGDGFRLLTKIGHTVSKPSPSIVPLTTSSKWVHRLSGLDWSFLKMRMYADGVKQFSKKGKILFTHFGISGPMVLNSSKEVIDLLSWANHLECSLDLYPDTEPADLDKKIVQLLAKNPKKQIENVLATTMPRALVIELLPICGIPFGALANNISKEKRRQLVGTLKDVRFPITGTLGYHKAVIADGGVDLQEIDFTTMQSRIEPSLYIIGDLLNINRPSGGYSLQLCWTTGYVAGLHAAEK